MKVDSTDVILQSSGLANVKINENKEVVITLKNKATLTLKPEVVENEVKGYGMIYLTGKENKKIQRLKAKMEEAKEEIAAIKGTKDELDINSEEKTASISDEHCFTGNNYSISSEEEGIIKDNNYEEEVSASTSDNIE
ncbi:MAG: hypothetical protein ACOCRX_00910 [Candidatus Woesearchaeota archaeon]